jgi:Zn-finger nucleic acid-binding protein
MPEKGKRLDCPVCAGEQMQKICPSEELDLFLDYCDRCGGMWFETGEVRQLRYCPPEALSGLISMKKQLYAVACPDCEHPMTRNAAKCSQCGRDNTINCPTCNSQLERVQGEQFTVDVCRDCRGAWFDNIDLSAVWNLQFEGSGGSEERQKDEITEDTVIAILRSDKEAQPEENGGGNRNVFGTIASIVGGIFPGSD